MGRTRATPRPSRAAGGGRTLGDRVPPVVSRFARTGAWSKCPLPPSGRFGGRSPHSGAVTQEARALVRSLWEGASFEEKEVAIELLGRPPLIDHEVGWRLGVRWVDAATGWALSDSLASGPIATEVAAHPERFAELLRWTSSKNFWRRRASAYALRAWVLAGELDRPFALLSRLLEDPERWVQRAVGTWLRECWKKDRARTERFLRREVRRLAPVTITVATERAPKSFREELRRSKGRRRVERRGY